MRQTVRLDEVRAPRAPSDRLTPAQVSAVDQSALTLDAHYSGVLTQVRNLLGTPTWRDAPADSVTSLSAFKAQAQVALTQQAQTQVAQGQQLTAQAQSIAALTQAAQSIATLRQGVQALQQALTSLQNTAATHTEVQALALQVGQMDAQLGQGLATVTAQVATLAQQVATDAARVTVLEGQAKDYVTGSGLTQQLINLYLVDQPLAGPQNRKNLTYQTPTSFVPSTLRVLFNGQALRQGPAGDYIVGSSSPGVASNTITLLHAESAPYAQDVLTATYIPA